MTLYLVNNLTENCPIPIDFIKDLMDQLEVLGVNGFIYGTTSDINQGQVHPFRKLEKRLPIKMANCCYGIFSDEGTRIFRDTYLRLFAGNDEGFFEKKVIGPNLWRQPDKGQPLLIKLMEKNGINTRIAWLLPSKFHKSWVNVFILHSSLSQQQMKEALEKHGDKIQRLLEVYSEYFSSKYIHLLNPVTNFKCLTSKSINILQLAAEGTSSPDIAKSLYLTERGVNYHIDRMKVLFGAKNRVQLISRAFQMGILNEMPQPSLI